MNLPPTLDLIFHLASLAFGLAGLVALLMVWRSGNLLDAAVKYLGLADPDGRISNKKVIATSAAFAGIVAFVSSAAKSVATQGDIGNNVLFLFYGILGGGATHAALQQKLGGGANGQRPSGTFPAPPDAAPKPGDPS